MAQIGVYKREELEINIIILQMAEGEELIVEYDDANAENAEETKHPLPGASAPAKQ